MRSEYGDEETNHEYERKDLSCAPPDDLGTDLQVSTIAFPSVEIAMAFASGLFQHAGAFVGIVVSGASVIVTAKREAEDDAERLDYEYEHLRKLIAEHRLLPSSGSA